MIHTKDEELKARIDAFVAQKLKPKILTLGQEEEFDKYVDTDARGQTVPNERMQRRLLISLCYDIPMEDVVKIPIPTGRDMVVAANLVNMGTQEKEDALKARKKLENLLNLKS